MYSFGDEKDGNESQIVPWLGIEAKGNVIFCNGGHDANRHFKRHFFHMTKIWWVSMYPFNESDY